MDNKHEFAYPFYYTGGNSRMIRLIPPNERRFSQTEVRDLIGILLTKDKIPRNNDCLPKIIDYKFSITQKDEIAKRYSGEYVYFPDVVSIDE